MQWKRDNDGLKSARMLLEEAKNDSDTGGSYRVEELELFEALAFALPNIMEVTYENWPLIQCVYVELRALSPVPVTVSSAYLHARTLEVHPTSTPTRYLMPFFPFGISALLYIFHFPGLNS